MEAQLRRLGPNSKIVHLKIPKECKTKTWWAGRGTSCQIYTKSIYASRKHFSISYKDHMYFISDLQSANGTFVNDEKVTNEKALASGNVISVGVPSQMQNEPESVVFVFEFLCGDRSKEEILPNDDDIFIINEIHGGSPGVLAIDKCEKFPKRKSKTEPNEAPTKQTNSLVSANKSLKVESQIHEADKTILFKTISSDVIIIEDKEDQSINQQAKKRKLTEEISTESKGKVKKLGINASGVLKPGEINEETHEAKLTDNLNSEDMMAYEALTQVDEPNVKIEPNLLNYSLTEELIEISDSDEDEWTSPSVPDQSKSYDDAEEDDDVVFLKTIIKSDYLPLVKCKVEDDFTEIDKKWMEKLLKVKQEGETKQLKVERKEEGGEEEEEEKEKEEEEEGSVEVQSAGESVTPALSDLQNEVVSVPSAAETLQEQKIVKEVAPKKSVRFELNPEVRYFEVATKQRLTPAEKGRLKFMKTIFSICNWNTQWLEECKRVDPGKDPTLCDYPLRKIPKKFPSHMDYVGAFIPAVLLQLWNSVKGNWITSGDTSFRMTVSYDSSENYHAENLCVYKCSGIVQSVKGHQGLLREGHLVLMRLHQIPDAKYKTPESHKYAKKLGYLVFGFVESKVYEPFHGQPLHPALAEKCASFAAELHIVRLTILVKMRPNFKIDKQKLIQLTVVRHISPEIRTFRGICFLSESPLCKAILKPNKGEFTLVSPPRNQDLVFKGPLDAYQRDVVSKLSHACTSTNHFLFSVHGPAGCGKSQVVVAFILQLLYGEGSGNRPKILFCTRSTGPLDEMVTKLKKERDGLDEKSRFKLVKVGLASEARPEVRDVSLSNLALSYLAGKGRKEVGTIQEAEARVLEKADVICTTCSTTGLTKMTSTFEKLSRTAPKKPRIVCVIDEAMNCRETDSVIPLLLGVTHLILVGDTHQLDPPFSAEKPHFLGADTSLFWRIYKNFVDVSRDLWPIFILKGQHRMIPGLATVVERLVYGTALSFPKRSAIGRTLGLRSHLLLANQTPEDVQNSDKKTLEEQLVVHLVRAITKVLRTITAGETLRFAVIVCDSRQSESLQSFLPKSKFPEVEVKDIEAFQAREVDVTLFHYDGSRISPSRVAVAITRARSSLFILANQQSIEVNPWFQKLSGEAKKYKYMKYVHPDMSLETLEKIVCD